MNLSPRPAPDMQILAGRHVVLEPIADETRFDELHEALGGEGFRDGWRFLAVGPFESRTAFDTAMRELLLAADKRFYAILPREGGRAAGFFSLMRIDTANGVIEVGNVALGPQLQRSRVATEAFFVLFAHVFDALGYRRLEWKCDNANAPSRSAAARLGFTFEGVFRQHMIVKGRNRDTAWFSILDGEWPARRAAFEAWLDDANFDAGGRQRRPLADLRTS
ncbi:GNAT family N-acetyltransferase [Aureimonas populi]|uniref:GNAT family N-acetyltransferase n=1 Tax=Aureimonas populi TaxID=1701758 RepID=A0ABW5CGZ3_9HYPH|nr:GNAT family protein [Aureimonas populi]